MIQNYIHGQFCAPVNNSYRDNINPSTGKSYGSVPESQEEDVKLAVESAQNAFKTWSQTSFEERMDFLRRIAQGIRQNAEEFALAESKDQGKPLWLAKTVDIPRAINSLEYFASVLQTFQTPCAQQEKTYFNYTLFQPIGVCGLIVPWNLPLYLLTWKLAPALAMGNTVVCKPSELTPMTAHKLCEILKEVKLPKGVCNVLHGTGPDVGSPLVSHPKVLAISFTGSTKTGEHILKGAAPYFKKVSLEMGGKNANVIFEDADLKQCLPMTLRSSFLNQGEICLSGSRIFVQEKIYAEFVEKFMTETKKLKTGNPLDENTFIGPLISSNHREKVLGFIERAKKSGLKVISGSKPEITSDIQGGYYVEPSVILDAPLEHECMQEEIFGPVVTITPFSDEQEAIDFTNQVKYGLSASIWTENLNRAHRVAAKLDVGTVWVNTWMKRDLRVPFGGTKLSGMGREGGHYSLEFYSEQKNICLHLRDDTP